MGALVGSQADEIWRLVRDERIAGVDAEWVLQGSPGWTKTNDAYRINTTLITERRYDRLRLDGEDLITLCAVAADRIAARPDARIPLSDVYRIDLSTALRDADGRSTGGGTVYPFRMVDGVRAPPIGDRLFVPLAPPLERAWLVSLDVEEAPGTAGMRPGLVVTIAWPRDVAASPANLAETCEQVRSDPLVHAMLRDGGLPRLYGRVGLRAGFDPVVSGDAVEMQVLDTAWFTVGAARCIPVAEERTL